VCRDGNYYFLSILYFGKRTKWEPYVFLLEGWATLRLYIRCKERELQIVKLMRRLTLRVVPWWRGTGIQRSVEGCSLEYRSDERECLRASSLSSAVRRTTRM